MKLKDKVALISGAARGIGKAIALRLAEEGANIIVTDINKEEAELVVQEIKGMGQDAIAIKCDVSKKAEITVLVEQSLEKFSKIDILVNNAGITKDGLFMRMKEEQWDLVMNINLKSIFLLSQEVFVKSMMKQKSGSIINISSLVGIIGNPGQVNYCAAKAGVIGFSKALSKEVSRWNIRVNAVAPGFIDTDMTRSMAEKYREELIKIIPMNRAGDASEVANTVLFFASDESSYITGQVLSVNGGTF
jgi:3-oxoacyl-[acyl-carrier protein] reductase